MPNVVQMAEEPGALFLLHTQGGACPLLATTSLGQAVQ